MNHPQRSIPIARPIIGEAEKQAVLAVLESGQLAQGARVEAFERAFAAYVGVDHAVAVSSGTAALLVALQAHGIGPGDEVITTAFSFIATATAIVAAGATPVFVDVDPFDLNIDPEQVEDAITEDTKAVIAVDLYGHPARLSELEDVCREYGIALIEDAAQAHGARHQGRNAGAWGTGCFSFYPTKNMTTAEGGMITTSDPAIAERARLIRNHGQAARYRHELLGLNWRMTDVHAAIGLAQLDSIDAWNEARIRNAVALSERLTRAQTPQVRPGDRHVFHQYTIRVPAGRRDAIVARLQEAGVGCAVHYPTPIHRQPVIQDLGYGDYELPNAEAAAESVLSIPVHPSLSEDDIVYIAEAVDAAIAAAAP